MPKSTLIMIFFAFVAGFGLRHFIKSDQSTLGTSNPYPFIDISREHVSQENFIVNIQPLRDQIRKISSELGPEQISVYLEHLNTGANISINNETKILPASLPKLPLAMIAYRKIQDGEWKPDDMLVVMESDKDDAWGELHSRDVGTPIAIEELIRYMLVDSDNTAYNILLRNLDNTDLDKIIEELGLEELFSTSGKVSSKEYSRILRSLYISSYLRREYSQKILVHLTQSKFVDYLQKPVPAEVPFAHKIGENKVEDVYADAGIVYLKNRPYMLTVISKVDELDGGRDKALSIMHRISESAYQYFSSYDQN